MKKTQIDMFPRTVDINGSVSPQCESIVLLQCDVRRKESVTCSCGICSVDGGLEYLRRLANSKECYTELSVILED